MNVFENTVSIVYRSHQNSLTFISWYMFLITLETFSQSYWKIDEDIWIYRCPYSYWWSIQLNSISKSNLQWRNSWWQCRQSMVPNTDFLLELNPTRKSLSMLGVNLWVAETTNNFTGTTPKSAPLSMKPIQSPLVPIKPN